MDPRRRLQSIALAVILAVSFALLVAYDSPLWALGTLFALLTGAMALAMLSS